MTTTKPLRAARYCRVSRSDQCIDLQLDETADLIERRGWELVATFADEGVSGMKAKRPGLDQLMAAARKRSFDVLIVYRADRLFRSLRHMLATLDELTALGIGFTSVSEIFDSTTPQGTLLLHLCAAFSQFERAVLIDRVRSGLAAARKRHVRLGRPKVAFDHEKALRLRAQGLSYREVAEQVGVSLATIQRLVKATVSNTPAIPAPPEAQVSAA